MGTEANSAINWAAVLYAPGIEEMLAGDLGPPLAVRISTDSMDSMDAEARITGVTVSDIGRKRIASTLLDAMAPGSGTRTRQSEAHFLRQAMLRAVQMSDFDLAEHIELMTRIPNFSSIERRVFEIEAQLREKPNT